MQSFDAAQRKTLPKVFKNIILIVVAVVSHNVFTFEISCILINSILILILPQSVPFKISFLRMTNFSLSTRRVLYIFRGVSKTRGRGRGLSFWNTVLELGLG